jgi:hypothetical protein
MKASLVGASDEPDELSEFIMTEEEMAWAKNTMTPDELAQTLSGGLDMNHFLVMLVTHSPHSARATRLCCDAWRCTSLT